MNTVNLKMYNILTKDLKLSESKATEFVEALQEVVIEDIKKEQQEYKSIFKDDFYKLDSKISETKNEMYKAMFVSGILQLLGILGGVMAIVKYMSN